MIRFLPKSIAGRIVLTVLSCLFLGPLFGAIPVLTWATLIDVTEVRYSSDPNFWGLLKFPGNFLSFFVGGYAFEFVYGFVQSAVVGLVYAGIGFLKNTLPLWSMGIAFGFAIATGTLISWDMLVCQCHRNALGHLVYEPAMFLVEYIFLATGCWLWTRKIWSSQT